MVRPNVQEAQAGLLAVADALRPLDQGNGHHTAAADLLLLYAHTRSAFSHHIFAYADHTPSPLLLLAPFRRSFAV